MRIYLHIGLAGTERIQRVLADKREQLQGKGVLFARAPGNHNHTRLFMAVSDPGHVDQLRHARGYGEASDQARLGRILLGDLEREIAQARPRTLILSAGQLGTALHRPGELARLHDMLRPFSDDIRIVAHVDEPARALVRHYAAQVFDGRAEPLERDIALADAPDWWRAALDAMPQSAPDKGVFGEVQAPPFWLDTQALTAFWEAEFGPGSVTLRAYDAEVFAAPGVTSEIREAFGIEARFGRAEPEPEAPLPSAAWLARARQLNALLLRLLDRGQYVIPRQIWRGMLSDVQIGGPPIDPLHLGEISARFAAPLNKLAKAHPGLEALTPEADADAPPWREADPEMGYRASQYLLAFMYRIERATREAVRDGKRPAPVAETPGEDVLSPVARALMPATAIEKFESLKSSSFAPHNRLGAVNEEELAAAYAPVPPRKLSPGSAGNVIVGCMKNEAPYIVEWVAYHRAIGVDNFLIYTNDCSDGTTEVLDRLQEMGIVQHRNNDAWKGKSPQQHALNQSLKEPLIRDAEWILHIDVDEFVNVRCGNGTLQDFFNRVPEATNVAMTWRLFGHNGVQALRDDFVIDQFETCAPKFCPKPHTVWGFKTMFRNIGAYAKISCHRPNKLAEGFRDKVVWVNGSGHDMTDEAAENGWRNSKKTIGYDLLQLNHYALRSAESFLIKRQRGRALHVDRSIGLNYWIRMDWSDHRDITIKRNIPRLREEYDRLMGDAELKRWHDHGFDWHKAKAAELHDRPEFQELFEQALKVKLSERERVAYALALDLES